MAPGRVSRRPSRVRLRNPRAPANHGAQARLSAQAAPHALLDAQADASLAWLPVCQPSLRPPSVCPGGQCVMLESETVSFTRMDEGTGEEYQLLDRLYKKLDLELTDNVLGMLDRLRGDKMGYQIDRYQHSLQTATRAQRDGADEETIVVALLHDIGDILAPWNHSDLAAAILQPYVS